MEIYVDLVFILNFLFDFVLLFSVNYILRRNINLKKIFLGSIVGEVTLLLLFVQIPSAVIFLIKLLVSFVMIFISFGFHDIRYFFKNVLYFYLVSMLMGGAIEFLNNQFSYSNNGLSFYNTGLKISYFFMVILGIFLVGMYVKSVIELRNNYSYYHKCKVYFDEINYVVFNAFLDTGNKLSVPYLNKSIVLIDKKKIADQNISNPIYVPYNSLNNHGILECYRCLKLEIDGKFFDKFLLGISNENFFLDGIDCIINNSVMEGLK